jgi:hypothetical protein
MGDPFWVTPSHSAPLVEAMVTGVERILAGALKLVEKN